MTSSVWIQKKCSASPRKARISGELGFLTISYKRPFCKTEHLFYALWVEKQTSCTKAMTWIIHHFHPYGSCIVSGTVPDFLYPYSHGTCIGHPSGDMVIMVLSRWIFMNHIINGNPYNHLQHSFSWHGIVLRSYKDLNHLPCVWI